MCSVNESSIALRNTYFPTWLCYGFYLMIAAGMLCTLSESTHAHTIKNANTLTSEAVTAGCLAKFPKEEIFCNQQGTFIDPPGDGIQSFHFAMQYDSSRYVFDPSKSGPVGPFAVGGDAGPSAGVGTQLIGLAPDDGVMLGAHLPGSTYSFTDIAGVVTIDMTFASPIFFNTDSNVLFLDFNLITPVFIDVSRTTVTYDAVNPGLDFTTLASSCTLSSGEGGCGSDTPTKGITIHYADPIPEPGAYAMMLAGLALMGLVARRRKQIAV